MTSTVVAVGGGAGGNGGAHNTPRGNSNEPRRESALMAACMSMAQLSASPQETQRIINRAKAFEEYLRDG